MIAAAALVAALGAGYLIGRLVPPAPPRPATSRVLVTAVTVPAGARLAVGDLRVLTARAAGLPAGALSPAAAAGLNGLVAARTMPAGTLLQRSYLAPSGALPGPGQALVGVALKPGSLPLGGLADGQRVLVLAVPTSTGGAALPVYPLASAVVWQLRPPGSAGVALLSLVVPARVAATLAGFAARGEIALIATGGTTSAGSVRSGSVRSGTAASGGRSGGTRRTRRRSPAPRPSRSPAPSPGASK